MNSDTTPKEKATAAYKTFLDQYKADPVAFAQDCLQLEPLDWQSSVMAAVADGERRLSVRSGHGVGKSVCAAATMLWFLLTKYPCKVVVTAPTASQLYDALFSEVKSLMKRLPPPVAKLIEATSDRVVLKASPSEAFITARTSSKEKPESLAGAHSTWVFLVADEASGIPEEVFESAAGSMSTAGATTLLLGNPVRNRGFFYRTHNELSDSWRTWHVSSVDNPLVSPDFISDMATRYGEESNAFRVRVMGEFALDDGESLIQPSLVEAAIARDVEGIQTAPLVYGVDVARHGTDKSALVKRKGNAVVGIQTWRQLDLMQLVGAIVHEIEQEEDTVEELMVDSIGIGAGVADRLAELGHPVISVNVSESSAMHPTAMRLRDELWLRAKEWLELKDCVLPDNEMLAKELVAPRYTFTSSGKLKVESKDEMKRRGLHSPDVADAFCLTFAGVAGTVARGAMSRRWQQPIDYPSSAWIV